MDEPPEELEPRRKKRGSSIGGSCGFGKVVATLRAKSRKAHVAEPAPEIAPAPAPGNMRRSSTGGGNIVADVEQEALMKPPPKCIKTKDGSHAKYCACGSGKIKCPPGNPPESTTAHNSPPSTATARPHPPHSPPSTATARPHPPHSPRQAQSDVVPAPAPAPSSHGGPSPTRMRPVMSHGTPPSTPEYRPLTSPRSVPPKPAISPRRQSASSAPSYTSPIRHQPPHSRRQSPRRASGTRSNTASSPEGRMHIVSSEPSEPSDSHDGSYASSLQPHLSYLSLSSPRGGPSPESSPRSSLPPRELSSTPTIPSVNHRRMATLAQDALLQRVSYPYPAAARAASPFSVDYSAPASLPIRRHPQHYYNNSNASASSLGSLTLGSVSLDITISQTPSKKFYMDVPPPKPCNFISQHHKPHHIASPPESLATSCNPCYSTNNTNHHQTQSSQQQWHCDPMSSIAASTFLANHQLSCPSFSHSQELPPLLPSMSPTPSSHPTPRTYYSSVVNSSQSSHPIVTPQSSIPMGIPTNCSSNIDLPDFKHSSEGHKPNIAPLKDTSPRIKVHVDYLHRDFALDVDVQRETKMLGANANKDKKLYLNCYNPSTQDQNVKYKIELVRTTKKGLGLRIVRTSARLNPNNKHLKPNRSRNKVLQRGSPCTKANMIHTSPKFPLPKQKDLSEFDEVRISTATQSTRVGGDNKCKGTILHGAHQCKA